MRQVAFAFLVLLVAALVGVDALKHHVEVSRDSRSLFVINVFGFFPGGEVDINMRYFKVKPAAGDPTGLILIKTEHESDVQVVLQEMNSDKTVCESMLSAPTDGSLSLPLTSGQAATLKHTFVDGEDALYHLVFARCSDGSTAGTTVSFDLEADFRNPDSWLSAGQAPLPTLYLCFALAFAGLFFVWVRYIKRNITKAHHIHSIMGVLLIIKVVLLVVESIRFHYLKSRGTAEAWEVLYLILNFLKGVLLFVVVLLIGAGWSILKPHLASKEKQLMLVVLILQVLANIAIVVIDEGETGTQAMYTWTDLLHVIDIICCCLILLPMVWSIRQMREASGSDGKVAINLQRLSSFRSLYISTVSFIYFTRIVVMLLGNFLDYHLLWLEQFLTEGATFIFYAVVGYKFRPAAENPYLPVSQNDEELEEFGLQDDDDAEARGSAGNSDVRVAL